MNWTKEFIEEVRSKCRDVYGDKKPTAPEILKVSEALGKGNTVERRVPSDGAPRTKNQAFNMVLLDSIEGLEAVKMTKDLPSKWSKVQKQRYLEAFPIVADRIRKLRRKGK